MNKNTINKYLRKFGLELHGTGYMQSLKKACFKDDAFEKQIEIYPTKPRVIFDVGANRGQVSIKYHEIFPDAIIHAFEPFPGTFNILKENVKNMDKVFPKEIALADKSGKEVFYINTSVDTNSLLESSEIGLNSDKSVKNISSIEVSLDTIDEYCGRHNINRVDILKLDIQGGELRALKGAQNLLVNKKISLIYTEAYFKQQYKDQPLFYDIAQFLLQYDYHLQDIYQPIYGKNQLAWCDAIFLPAQ